MESGSFFNVEHPRKSKSLSFDNLPMFPGSITSVVQFLNINHSNDMQGTYTRQKKFNGIKKIIDVLYLFEL
jgi:hypothetical protein